MKIFLDGLYDYQTACGCPLRLYRFVSYNGPMRKYPRIEIDQKAFDGLQIEAVLKGKTVRDIATEAILSYISKEALMVLDHKTYEATTGRTAEVKTAEPVSPAATLTTYTPPPHENRPKQLAKDKDAIAHIRHLWTATEKNYVEIARAIDRPRTTVESLIERYLEKGLLPPRPKREA